MVKPKVFLSSTYLDLQEIRDSVHKWIEGNIGYESIPFEKGCLFFNPLKSITQACYDEVKTCQFLILIIAGRYGSKDPESDAIKKNQIIQYNSVTKKEYLSAIQSNVITYVFIRKEVMHDYEIFKRNPGTIIKYTNVDDENIFNLIRDIEKQKINNHLQTFDTSSDIIDYLREQWAGLFHVAVKAYKDKEDAIKNSRINCYKMFKYRYDKNITFTDLAKKTRLNIRKLERLESIRTNTNLDTYEVFQKCLLEDIIKIEKALDCPRDLKAGKDNDFLTQYISFYKTYKNSKQPVFDFKNNQAVVKKSEKGKFKVVVFDFDGTLTYKSPQEKRTSWELIWASLGYDNTYCTKYFVQYINKEIDHQQWCNITADHFIKKNLRKEHLIEIANKIILMPGVEETLENIKKAGIDMYITSGSIIQIIEYVLGDLKCYFKDIRANKFIFDTSNDNLLRIEGTKFDFEGKASYIQKIANENKISTKQIVYVGNSINDVTAYKSGAYTICVNPHFTDPNNKTQWKDNIVDMRNMKEIQEFIL
jgi:HAD superfamily phosphoserine phosphatase-like hydrolase